MQDKAKEKKKKKQDDIKPDEELLQAQEAERDPEAELEAMKDKYLRTMAEFENYRNRTNQEKSDWIRHASQELALKVCDVVDNFERAIAQAKEEDLETPFGKGVLLIEKQLLNALENEGVKRIEALGEEFDPEFHDALSHIPSEYDENIVAAIIKNGYTMHDKVIRAVQVAVSNGKLNIAQEE
ncbi:MAG TPA: nucleotide exchange factor GrpE [Candidatus Cloacimonetes bacterium]|nr:nucleotide exchange factor GrpE [Candidatus Cloacimonadota bacterium]